MTDPDEPEVIDPEDLEAELTTRKYLVTTARGEFVIALPSHLRLTFGAVNPGAPPHGRDLHCLRVWEGNSKTGQLRAVFCDVRGFRDLSLPLARKIETETSNAQWKRDDLGNFEATSRKAIEATWDREDIEPPFGMSNPGDPF